MLDFRTSRGQDYVDFGRELWLDKDRFESHEQASQYTVARLFDEFITETGDPQIALARIFRLTEVEDLPADVRGKVGAGERLVMALTGTWGIEESWQHRSLSRGHQAIPISHIAFPKKIPMFQAILRRVGDRSGAFLPDPGTVGGQSPALSGNLPYIRCYVSSHSGSGQLYPCLRHPVVYRFRGIHGGAARDVPVVRLLPHADII